MHEGVFPSVRRLLESRVAAAPDKQFLISDEDGTSLTYTDFDRAVNRTANLLLASGVRKGDRVSLFLTNRIEYLIFYFACFKIGAWAGPVNALLTPAEVEYVLDNSLAAVAVTEMSLLPVLLGAAGKVSSLRSTIVVDLPAGYEATPAHPLIGYRQHAEAQSATLEPVDIGPDDEAVIIYTSGTTGKPKGVLLTHGNLLANARQIAEWLRLTPNDRALMMMPLFHANALMTTGLAALWAGGSIVLATRFSASRHWATIARHGVSYFGSVATMLSMLLNTYPEGVKDSTRISSLRFALCGSAPVPAEVITRFESTFNCPVVEGYGLSESTCRSTFNPIDDRRPGSVGLPIGNEVKIFDDQDRELGPCADGETVGEIVLRGPNIMKGYYRNEAATREAFRSGWFHTGDLGYQDEDGFFHVIDRKSDMIIRAGENIYPREIDEVLYRHPKIKEAATIGVPDPLYGEDVKSFVVVREGESLTERELLDFCSERLASFKCPKSIEFVEDIPKGPTGKLLKRELTRSRM
jgi:acyl-CoA synthetase (AMP-forming)/AMP-acid ligase II